MEPSKEQQEEVEAKDRVRLADNARTQAEADLRAKAAAEEAAKAAAKSPAVKAPAK